MKGFILLLSIISGGIGGCVFLPVQRVKIQQNEQIIKEIHLQAKKLNKVIREGRSYRTFTGNLRELGKILSIVQPEDKSEEEKIVASYREVYTLYQAAGVLWEYMIYECLGGDVRRTEEVRGILRKYDNYVGEVNRRRVEVVFSKVLLQAEKKLREAEQLYKKWIGDK